ncbi:MAG: paraquat-inducible protein A [Bacteroidales bacterium]|nr:paraquat-inducible protein A [Bacteroidales bacterium]
MTEHRPGRAHLKIAISTVALVAAMVLNIEYISLARQNQQLKTDLAEINHIRYGLLNVDEWSSQLSTILSIKILEFQLTPESRDKVLQNLENILYQLIDDVEQMMKTRTSGRLSGIKSWFSGFTINLDPLRDSVPSYASQIVNELNRPENKAFIQQFLSDKLNEFASSTYNLDEMAPLQVIMERYDCIDKDLCKVIIQEEIQLKNRDIKLRVILILLLVTLAFMVNLLTKRKLNQVQATLLIAASFCLLLGGITTPMIDLEARIDHLMLQLMGEKITFLNNIIFFQSKSITDVVRILIEEGTLPMIFVGVLVFTFSIIFPSLKLISSLLYSYRINKLRENILIQFFVIKSGKWSMADVMVVAIFMAYIGFNGIIGSQLDQLTELSEPVEIFTTNGTQLLGGFYLFLLFCVSSLVLSETITRKS